MKIINNTTEKLADDLRVTIKKRSRVSMAAACFSVYAFEELKAQLENLDELRFIFTSPAFLDEKPKKAQREFYIPRLNRERTLHGSEFEIKLRSEFRQRAISQECAHWIREKARFKSNKTMEGMTGFLTVDSDSPVAYAPVNGFTREDLGCDRGGRMFSIYTPTNYILPSKLEKYAKLNHEGKNHLTQAGREQGIRRLMSINLLKRLESSLHSFQLTLGRIEQLIAQTLDTIAHYDPTATLELNDLSGVADLDADDQESDLFTVGRKVKIELADMDYVTWRKDLEEDQHTLRMLLKAVSQITPAHDSKLRMLLDTITEKIEHPINPGNKKVIIFTAFSDTAQYLYDHVSAFAGEKYGLNTALVTGSVEGRTTIPKFKADLNNVLTCFSPRSKDKAALMPDGPDIDLLIATDCISEGQNLQDCDCLINYDIHWNPVRLVQRFGRIDRIGSKNDVIQLINFWPDMDLDSYINLKGRVETRMKALVMTSTGDDNLLSPEEQGNLEYRREQLKRLQTEVVDLEEMGTGVSITDLGLNEFRMEVMEYAKRHPELETTPGGISAVTQALPDAPAGVVFVLKNVHNEININDRNRLHPYYLVYLTEEGEIVYDHLSPRSTLETMRQLCHGKTEPIQALCRAFNEETRCGEEMQLYSDLLEEAVLSIVDAKEDSDLDSLFRAGGTTALLNQISGLDDFELICFLVVKEG